MKKLLVPVLGIVLGLGFVACSDTKGRYVDLRSGEPVTLLKDEETGLMVDESTRKPVYIYVDTKTNDTIYGTTGAVINGQVIKNDNGEYVYKSDGDGEYKVKGDDYKMKVEKDGDVKIKDGDSKVKIDGESGEKKVKNDD